MVGHIIKEPLGLVLIFAAHMVYNVQSQVEVTGILGSNITLKFTFSANLTENSHFAVYTTGKKKIAEYTKGKEGDVFRIHPENSSVLWHITNLKQNDSGCYLASLFIQSGPPKESNKVQLRVQEKNITSTVPSVQSSIPVTEDSGSSSHVVTVLVVSPVLLLAAVLPCLIWCLVRTKDKQQQAPQQSSNSTMQETAKVSNNASSLVYSVLDFPKRPATVLEINQSETEYAAVSYLPESRRV